MSSKRELYFSGTPEPDPRKPLRGEMTRRQRQMFMALAAGVALFGVGVLVGVEVVPDSGPDLQARVAELEMKLRESEELVAGLRQEMQNRGKSTSRVRHHLTPQAREQHVNEGAKHAKMLLKYHAQAAAELVAWFVDRWNDLLDSPRDEDRIKRRAELLSRLVGGMADNLPPEAYIPWQSEFLGGEWLGELHYDLNKDGLPGKRTDPNRRDGFSGVSVCHIAMALNQTVRDAHIMVMPELRCDRPDVKMSVFLQGATLDDALNEFVRALRREGFLVRERMEGDKRLILIGSKTGK